MSSYPDREPPTLPPAPSGYPAAGWEPSGYSPPTPNPFRQDRPGQAPGSGRRRGGFAGGLLALLAALAAYGKWVLLILVKFPALGTLVTLLVSFAAYAVFFGPWFAAGLVVMILVHEMGHVVEIRRQGMHATAPLFIPFLGAAIFQRQNSTDALKQAQIGIAGPIAGTVAATVAFVLFGTTHQPVLMVWAYLGFFINLFNLIPLGMLDGGWIMAVVSKWFQVVGLAAMALAVFFLGFSPIILVIAILGVPAVLARFRNDRLPYYQSVPVPARLAMGAAWLALTGYLGFALLQSHQILQTLVR
ncbi:MAG: site-2 protease family protein [Candidatus Dormibacteraeota bacterium]|nr:site-2 protease family protein [Candidatus Dormibacteraeota bacterium]